VRSSSSFFAWLLLVGADAVLGDHVDSVLDQVGVQLGDLLLADLHLLERRRDLLEGEIPPLAAERDEAAHLLELHGRLLARLGLHHVRHRLQRLDRQDLRASLPPVPGFAGPPWTSAPKYRAIAVSSVFAALPAAPVA